MERAANQRGITPDSMIRLRCKESRFWYRWMQFLRPFHGLPASEMEIAGRMLQMRSRLSAQMGENGNVDEELMSKRRREELCRICGITPQRLQVSLGKFRKAGLINDGRIDEHYIPSMEALESGSYKLIVWIDIE